MTRPAFDRSLAIILSVVGLAACIGLFATFWLSPDENRLRQIQDLVDAVVLVVQFGIALIIAWRGGTHAPNVALALALVFINGADTWMLWQLHVWRDSWLLRFGAIILFYFGAAFFVRASQLFPRAIAPADVASSRTIWGRVSVLRTAATILLRPWVVWVICGCLAALLFVSSNIYVTDVVRMCVLLLGILYFYITLRSGDANARAKVLWFLEATIATLAITLVAIGIRAALGDVPAPMLRASLSFVLTALNSLAITICFLAAVFYAGVIDPALVVRKTVVVAVTTTLLLFVFAAGEHYLVHLVVHGIGVTNSVATAVLGALLGYAFHPVKHRLEHFLKRVLPASGAAAESHKV